MKRTSALVALVALFSSSWVHAGKWYHVEAVIFEHLEPYALNAEVWSQNTGMPNLTKAETVHTKSSETAMSDNLLIRPQEKWLLKEQVRKLRNDKRYHVLAHTAWQQLLEPAQTGQPVLFRVGNKFEVPTDGSEQEKGAAGEGKYPLNGMIQVSLNKFLQVKCDLVLSKPVYYTPEDTMTPLKPNKDTPWFRGSTARLWSFRTQQSKKMRSNELHYIDHPMVGVLIKIIPMEGDLKEMQDGKTGGDALSFSPPEEATEEELG